MQSYIDSIELVASPLEWEWPDTLFSTLDPSGLEYAWYAVHDLSLPEPDQVWTLLTPYQNLGTVQTDPTVGPVVMHTITTPEVFAGISGWGDVLAEIGVVVRPAEMGTLCVSSLKGSVPVHFTFPDLIGQTLDGPLVSRLIDGEMTPLTAAMIGSIAAATASDPDILRDLQASTAAFAAAQNALSATIGSTYFFYSWC